MNILSFDIEEWFTRQKRYGSDPSKYAVLDRYLSQILDMLDERQIKGTFFCLGELASHFPSVVKEIDRRGHEIGCHSNSHQWLNKLSIDEVREDTRVGIDVLQQCIGKKIVSYRAPAFSIGNTNKWALEVLAENGIERDSSVFPIARDFGGFPNFGHKKPVTIHYEGFKIKEFPICTIKLLGKDFAYSGGGYFRFFPLWFIKNEINKSEYAMTYFHIGDLLAESNSVLTRDEYEAYFKEPGTLKARYTRYIKYNLGKKSTFKKLSKLIDTVNFVSIDQADKMIDWNQQDAVVL